MTLNERRFDSETTLVSIETITEAKNRDEKGNENNEKGNESNEKRLGIGRITIG